MLRITPGAGRAYIILALSQAVFIVPLLAILALLAGGDVVGNIMSAVAIALAFAFGIWAIGMLFDLIVVILKFVGWHFIVAVAALYHLCRKALRSMQV